MIVGVTSTKCVIAAANSVTSKIADNYSKISDNFSKISVNFSKISDSKFNCSVETSPLLRKSYIDIEPGYDFWSKFIFSLVAFFEDL